jgi:hypothetical protein
VEGCQADGWTFEISHSKLLGDLECEGGNARNEVGIGEGGPHLEGFYMPCGDKMEMMTSSIIYLRKINWKATQEKGWGGKRWEAEIS